ncbi:group II intron reverse transcriptase/maturase [Candidatus Neptunochlamydia vexilliferae]|nr:group II intron reverse transcriptase/maturase [Candidatus Neptunochlamydia vexilliferae]
MRTEIDRVAEKARRVKSEKFTSLAHHITPELLKENLKKIPKRSGVGIDNQSVEEARKEFEKWSPEMIQSIHRKGYKPPPVRRAYIPKIGKKEMRPIALPTTKDKVLQKSTADVLNAIYEQDFLECSFGGRPNRSAHQAIATLNTVISTKKVSWIYEADLKNYFGSLDHKRVLEFMMHRVKDPRIITLIRRWLKAGVMEDGKYQSIEEGTPQGGPISVLISNVYLHYTLDLWVEKVVKPRMRGEIYLVRYIDDFVVCFQYRSDAIRFQKVLKKRLAKFSLEIEPSKTRLIEFGRYAEKWRKSRGKKVETFYFLGLTWYCSKNRNGNYKVGMKTEKQRLRRSHSKMKMLLKKIRHFKLRDQKEAINRVLRGHYRYYGVGGNSKSLNDVYFKTLKTWRKTLSSRSQKGNLKWDKFNKILETFPLERPKIYIPYKRIESLARL